MADMMGSRKWFGRWSIDRAESNRAERAREKRAWQAESADLPLFGLSDWDEHTEAVSDAPAPHEGPERP